MTLLLEIVRKALEDLGADGLCASNSYGYENDYRCRCYLDNLGCGDGQAGSFGIHCLPAKDGKPLALDPGKEKPRAINRLTRAATRARY